MFYSISTEYETLFVLGPCDKDLWIV